MNTEWDKSKKETFIRACEIPIFRSNTLEAYEDIPDLSAPNLEVRQDIFDSLPVDQEDIDLGDEVRRVEFCRMRDEGLISYDRSQMISKSSDE